jgi:ribosomal protein S18 acetylase RimI-like enzyme
MEIELASEPLEPAHPDGLTIRSYRPEDDDEALYVAHQQAFAEHWEFTPVGLEVDSENETGATHLYERAGMHVSRRYATYEKTLR